MDRRSLLGGNPVDHTIRQAIESARAVIVLVTRDTAGSQYVQFEWSCARAASVPVIPVTWGQPVDLPKPWDRLVSLSCPDDGSENLADQILATLHATRNPSFLQPHDLAIVCGDDSRSRLIAKLVARHTVDLGLSVWSSLESLIAGFESEQQLEEALSRARLVALAISASTASAPTLRHAASWAYGRHKTVLRLHTDSGIGDPWPFMGNTKFLDFSGEFAPAWSGLKEAILPPLQNRLRGLAGFSSLETLPEFFVASAPATAYRQS